MKKKIGELTLRELKAEQDKICNVNCNVKFDCSECPFKHCCIDETIDLEQEIEVEEE